MGLDTETAKGWLADRLGQEFDAAFSFEELHVRWNLGVRLKGISIENPPFKRPPSATGSADGFTMRLDSFRADPRLFSLISGKPDIDFIGDTSSGGQLSGSYAAGALSFSFRDVSFKDLSIAAIPLPSNTTLRGSGTLKVVPGNGTIDTEIDGVPGGKQRLKIPGGTAHGKLTIVVSLPTLS